MKNERLLRNFGITLDRYMEMQEEQGGVCKLCGGSDPSGRELAVDHSHQTGAVRALLCSRCNAGVAMFEQQPELLDRAKAYLAHHSQE